MKHLLCYGDSNTYGLSLAPVLKGLPPERFDENTRWSSLLQDGLGECRVFEAGMNGRTTTFDDPMVPYRNGLATLDPVFKSNAPYDLVIVMLGTNDAQDMYDMDAFSITCGLGRLVLRLRELIASSLNPNTKILLVAPPRVVPHDDNPLCFSSAAAGKVAQLGAFYEILAQDFGCYFANAGAWVSGDPNGDGVHLTAEGHRELADHLIPVIKDIFDEIDSAGLPAVPLLNSMFLRD